MNIDDTLSRLEHQLDIDRIRAWLAAQDAFTTDWAVTYLAESLFFAEVVHDGLPHLEPGSKVLEIGGGLGYVSRTLADLGMDVTCFEPASRGFSRMTELSALIDEAWRPIAPKLHWRAEPFTASKVGDERFDYVFATNVLQHVPDPADLVIDASGVLARHGTSRFICPNYTIPFDPHFNIPTFWNKSLAYRIFRRRIIDYPLQETPCDFWDDLSFPRARPLRRRVSECGVPIELSRAASLKYLDRLSEPRFLERKGPMFRLLAGPLKRPLHRALVSLPLTLLPIVDLGTRVSITRQAE